MADRVIIQPLKIKNARTGKESATIKVCVDATKHCSSTDNIFTHTTCVDWISFDYIVDDDIKLLKALKYCDGNNDIINRMVQAIKDDQEVTIGNKKYIWEQIKDVYSQNLYYDEETDDFTAVE